MLRRMVSPYTGWMMAAVGLLGLTYGLDHALEERHERTGGSWAITALATPLAVAGLAGWTMALFREARH